jgi:serpin B
MTESVTATAGLSERVTVEEGHYESNASLPAMKLSLAALLATSLAACGNRVTSSPGAGTVDVARSSLARDAAPNVPAADRAALVTSNTAFAIDLYDAIARQPGSAGQSLFFSPYSVSLALAMTYAGAHGKTATQIASTLRFTLPPERLHPAFDWLDLQLGTRGANAQVHTGVPFRLHVANSLWGERTMTFAAPFLDTLAMSYGAGVQLVDFVGDPDGARVAINGWVSDRTESKIHDLLARGTLDALTRFVIVNAIYFSAAWAAPFDAKNTRDATFHRLDGGTERASMMNEVADMPYAEGNGWQAVAIPYDGGELSMLVVLPAEGTFGAFESKLEAGELTSIAGALGEAQVTLSLPKFQQQPDAVSLRDRLKELGMSDPFDPDRADLSGVTTSVPIYITDVIHKAFVTIDEKGTEAAAATAVIGGTTSIATKRAIVVVDRPFVFAIRDDATGTLLFLGRAASL